MVGVVETEASDGLDVLGREGRKQKADIGNIIRHVVSSKDVTGHDAGLSRLRDISNAAWENGITVVCLAVPGKKADESLCMCQRTLETVRVRCGI